MSRRRPDWERRLSAWLDGELGEVEAREVREHLMADPEARARLREWQELRDDLALLQPEDALSPERASALAWRLDDRIRRETGAVRRALGVWSAAAAVLLVFGLGLLIGLDRRASLREDAWASEPSAVDRAIEEWLRPRGTAPAAPVRPGVAPPADLGAAAAVGAPADGANPRGTESRR